METFSDWIESELKNRGWKPADLARAAGITDATLSRVLSGSRNPGPELCRAIAAALNEPEEKVFRKAGLLSPLLASEDSPTLRELWDLVKRLSPEEQEEIFRYTRYRYRQEQEEKREKRRGLDAAESTSGEY
jgi:transcriptional regulator with XRE-family HTH domain